MKRRSKLLVLSFLIVFPIFNELYAQEKQEHLTNGQIFMHSKRPRPQQGQNSNCPNNEFRTIDGTCNNVSRIQNEEWGASDIELYRVLLADYGTVDHYNSMGGESRLSPREISNALCVETSTKLSTRNLSSFVFTWGQFIDHDITLTPEARDEYEPIGLPANEPLFTYDIPFYRSAIYPNTGLNNYRQQTNLITSWLDGSNVYGSELDRASWLRTHEDGKLKTSEGGLLPFNTLDGEYESDIDINAPSMAGDGGATIKTYVAGDVRAGEQPGLTALHTLFVRTHNAICDRLIDQGVSSDEEIYQKARKEVGAIIQNISYKEFLPALGISLNKYRGYNDRIQADISNVFATAAYRLGHTMVTDELLLLDNNCRPIDGGSLSLLEGFFNPEILINYSIEPILKGLSAQTQNAVDLEIIDNLRNFLFGDPNSADVFGLDLASLNIQRGRDHGLPDYNELRKKYTGNAARSFRDITRNRRVQKLLSSVYSSVDDIDLWVGLLAEDKLPNASVGPTLHAILKKQFEAIRDGDRYYFKNDKSLSRRDKERIEAIRLSQIIKDHSTISNLERNVFYSKTCEGKSLVIQNRAVETNTETRLYPNPATNNIVLEYQNTDDVLISIEIFDMSGKRLQKLIDKKGRVSINISDFQSGTYMIILHKPEGSESLSFVKQDY